jgi:hypothetical protein
MDHDPLVDVIDERLVDDTTVLEQLQEYRREDKLLDLPGVNPVDERERLVKILDGLVDLIIAGIEKNPTKLWVLAQFQPALLSVECEDTEGREHFGRELESIMDILRIASSDGLLAHYLGGI